MLSKKWKEQEQRNLLKKANESCKALDELFENSAPEEKGHAISELKDSEPGISCSNKSVNFSDIISNTSETKQLWKNILRQVAQLRKNQPTKIVFPKTIFGSKGRHFHA